MTRKRYSAEFKREAVAMARSPGVTLKQVGEDLGIIYWVEAIALGAFGVAWIVAGRSPSIIVEEDQKLHLFRNRVRLLSVSCPSFW